MLTSEVPTLFKNILRFFKSYCHIESSQVRQRTYESLNDPYSSGNSLEEDCIFTYHVDSAVTWVESEEVVADEVGLLVEPLHLEHVPFFLNLLHFRYFLL